MKAVYTLLLLLKVSATLAQFEKNYVPVPVQDTIPSAIHNDLKQSLQRAKESIPESKSSVNNYVRSLYDKRFELLVETFNKDYFITDSEPAIFLQNVLQKIYKSNTQLSPEARVYVFRSETPNAISFGDGTIGFTLGLLARMESEAQVAFVLCHELAHLHLGHSDLHIQRLAEINYDRDLQKKIRKIKNSSYERYSKLKSLYEDLGLSINQHSRQHEFEADSVGLSYFLKTDYDLQAPLRTMEILDSADMGLYSDNIDFKARFNCKEYPFKDGWLDYSKPIMWHSAPVREDSTRTHPSCLKRLAALKRQMIPYQEGASSRYDEVKRVTTMRQQSQFEIVASAYHFEQYGRSLFNALLMIERYPGNAYLHAIVGKNLYQLYEAQKNHELGKVLELPDSRFDENYDRFLNFIHALRLNDLSSLSYYSLVNGKEDFFSTEEYLHALWLSSHLSMSRLDPEKVKNDYLAIFPSGRYRQLMN